MKLILITIFTCFSLVGFSQKPSPSVCIPGEVAKQITEDLIAGDSAYAMLSLAISEVNENMKMITAKDSIISKQQLKESYYLEQIGNDKVAKEALNSLLAECNKDYTTLSKDFKKYKTKKKFTDILLTGGLIALVTIIITK
jgi:hypothetical protein